MHEDATTDVDLSGSNEVLPVLGGIVRIGVRSTTGRKEDKIVRLSINIPNSTRNISVEVPLQKILEDDDDDDNVDDINRSLTFNESSEGAMCSKCQMIRQDESSKMIAYEIKTSLRQLLLSKLLERLAKKTLFRNYEKLIAKEIDEQTEVSKNLSITYNTSENLMQTSSMADIFESQPSQVRLSENASKVQNIESNSQSSENIIVKDFTQLKTNETISSAQECQTVRHSKDVTTTTIQQVTEKVDKSTTIHKDESTQTGQLFDISSDSINYRPSLESKHRQKQPSSVSSSCQTDVEEIVSLEALSAGSDDSKTEAKRDVVSGKASHSRRETFERINGDLEEEYEREDIRTPQPCESKSSYIHDDSATETESVTSSFMSSVSSSATKSKPEKTKSVMSFSKDVARVAQNLLPNPEVTDKSKKYEIQTKIDYTSRGPKTTASSKTENHSTRPNDSKSSVSDSYLKNLKGKTTSSEQVHGKEKVEEFGIRRQSKDNQSFISSSPTSKVEQVPAEDIQHQKQSTKGRSFSSKPVNLETTRLFNFGVDYTKNPEAGSNTSSQSRNTQQPANTSSNQASKPQQSKSTRKNIDSESLRSGSAASSTRSEDLTQSSTSSKSPNHEKTVKIIPSKNQPEETPAPETKVRGRLPSSFKNLVSAFETKISEDHQPKKLTYKSNPPK